MYFFFQIFVKALFKRSVPTYEYTDSTPIFTLEDEDYEDLDIIPEDAEADEKFSLIFEGYDDEEVVGSSSGNKNTENDNLPASYSAVDDGKRSLTRGSNMKCVLSMCSEFRKLVIFFSFLPEHSQEHYILSLMSSLKNDQHARMYFSNLSHYSIKCLLCDCRASTTASKPGPVQGQRCGVCQHSCHRGLLC